MKIIYFHGFGSSATSGTVKTLRRLLPDYEVMAPDIPVDPVEALPFLKAYCQREQPDVIVGTSMGGMYAQQMQGFRRILVNPAFEMSRKSMVLKVGIFDYFKPRLDGSTTFTITPEIMRNFAEMEEHQFDELTEVDVNLVWGLFGTHDQQVNSESVYLQHYANVLHFEGEHRLSGQVIEQTLVPLISKLAGQ